MAYATSSDGTRIHYEVRGPANAPCVVLIQGLGLSARLWFDLPDRLAAAPEGGHAWRVVTLDNRGVGRSDRPRTLLSVTMGTLADDVATVLDDARVERACVVGISLGGMIAQHVALRHPTRVEGLVLLATTAGLPFTRWPGPITLATLLTLPILSQMQHMSREAGRSLARLLLPKRDIPRASELPRVASCPPCGPSPRNYERSLPRSPRRSGTPRAFAWDASPARLWS